MTTGDHTAEAPGEHLYQELLWVHRMIRRDLEAVRTLAGDVLAGRSAEEVRVEIRGLQTNSPLWRLRVNCLYYCRFVHGHHNLEDRLMFPALRKSNPALRQVVDKLEADHRVVSDFLDEVEAVADAIVRHDDGAGRGRLVSALNGLAEHLLEHLAFEEENVAATMRTWHSWPGLHG